jgi:hypothetical protein
MRCRRREDLAVGCWLPGDVLALLAGIVVVVCLDIDRIASPLSLWSLWSFLSSIAGRSMLHACRVSVLVHGRDRRPSLRSWGMQVPMQKRIRYNTKPNATSPPTLCYSFVTPRR